MGRRFCSRRGQRGFSHITTTLEAAAVLGWFVIFILGEKLLSDSVTARRSVEDTAEQSSVAAAAQYCESQAVVASTIPGASPTGTTGVHSNGKLDIQNLLSLIAGLGIGSQRTMTLYTAPLQATTSRIGQGGVQGAAAVGGGSHTFYAERSLACQERPKDVSQTSIDQYRKSIFDINIAGF